VRSSGSERLEFVIRGAYVVTMEATGDLPVGDVHVRDGAIVAVGQGLDVPEGAIPIDGRDRVVLPGFVDTHWHLWSSLLRGVIGDGDRAYFPVKNRLAPHFTSEDTYRSVALGLAEATNAGITTVNDWDHNVRSPAHADANARAIIEAGLRARYSYGNPDKLDPQKVADLEDIARFERDWSGPVGDGRLTVGMAMRGPVRTTPDVCRREWAFARDRGLPMTMHCGGRREESGRYCELEAMAAAGYLGSDLQVVHAVHATPREIDLLASAGTHLSLSPMTELGSMGIPPVGDFLAAGLLVSLSTDTLAIPTTADMFAQMKVTLAAERARTASPTLTPRRVLEMATIDGARDLRLEDVIGSLRPGKRADLITVRLDSLNMAPGVDPVGSLVAAATPADVDLVVVDGRVLKESGKLTRSQSEPLVAAARASLRAIMDRASWDPGLPRLAAMAGGAGG
jgi:5-methylthioadenosine/S-adenosylhomocysteine deaminase